MDPLFPTLPEDLSALSDDELAALKREHEVAAELIDNEDPEFTKGLSGDEVLAQYEAGVEQIEKIVSEQVSRVEAEKVYAAKKAELAARRKGTELSDDEPVAEDDSDTGDETDAAEVLAVEEPVVEEAEVLVASAEPVEKTVDKTVRLRRPPAPTGDRISSSHAGAVLVAAAGVEGARPGMPLDRKTYASVISKTANRWGRVAKHDGGAEQRVLLAAASFDFPEERKLNAKDWAYNSEKIAEVIPNGVPGMYSKMSPDVLVASGGLCAPLEPIYTMPNWASQARPVRDALPSFQAERGGVNVPAATTIGDITSAITVIEESDDALGGTYATKSCQALDCPAYTETAITVISHCREYGNLNAMAWPEKIAHENDLTMAAHARAAENYLLDRIKALSVNVTNGAETLGALIYLVDGIVKSGFGIRSRLRMPRDTVLRVLLPDVLPDLLLLDTVQTQFGRFESAEALIAYLGRYRIAASFYMDSPTTGDSQIADSSQTAAALDGLPDHIQWAIFPEGAFIHIDSGSLELGIVRDSTLNSTNDYQFFGETFENVARIGPAQSAYWVTSDLCANGNFPPAGTTRTCD